MKTATMSPQRTKSQQLAKLQKQLEAMRERLFAPGVDPFKGELSRKWRKLHEQVSNLEGSFVLYQGQEIDAEKVNYISGCVPTSTEDLDGDENLYRDSDGRYYLERKLSHSDRVHLHRISRKAAILWACTRLNSDTLDLRRDAAAAIDGRSTLSPSHLVTIELTPRQYEMAMRMVEYDERPSLGEWIKADLEESVVTTADCFEESQVDTRAAWNGEPVKIRNNKEAA